MNNAEQFKKFKRVFVIVMDSVGIGYDETSYRYNDEGANTLVHISNECHGLNIPTLNSLGLGDLDNIQGTNKVEHPNSFVCKAQEESVGKDTMTGHWEMMGIKTVEPFVTFTETGFPKELIDELEKETGHKIIGNIAASGTEIIKELGEQQMKENSLIVYTSADSVLQIAAHEEVTGLEELYRCCEIARKLCMQSKYRVGRVIARPFVGTNKDNFKRTPNRHDLALKPPHKTVMNILDDNGIMVSCVGKIGDIFDGYGVTKTQKTISNDNGMDITQNEVNNPDFNLGLCFVNLVEFDSEYGHRRNPLGYGKAIEQFDVKLNSLLKDLRQDDLLIITADHGNDPTWHGTDHTRERVPLLMYSKLFDNGKMLDKRNSFADIGATILYNFKLEKPNNLIGSVIKELF